MKIPCQSPIVLHHLMLLLVLLSLTACSPAPPDLTALENNGGTIFAKRTFWEPPLDPDDPAWRKAAPKEVSVYPQRTVQPASQTRGSAKITVRALYNRKVLAVRLEWADQSQDLQRGIGRFADGAAVQWPARYGPEANLPYVGMGHSGEPVTFWFWRADGTTETLAAEGFGTLTTQASNGVQAKGVWKDGSWRVVFRRVLQAPSQKHGVNIDPAAQGLIPMAVAVWNGAAGQRDGKKLLSGWQVLYLDKAKVDSRYVVRLAATPATAGDAGAGERLMMEKGCAACHAFPGNSATPVLGPALTYAGGIHRSDYLSESLVEPSKVIVPGKGFSIVHEGKRLSLMPPFLGSEQERNDIVSFLKTLR